MQRLGNKVYTERTNMDSPIHKQYRRAQNDYTKQIRKTKKDHWEEWLENIGAASVWTASKLVSGPSSDRSRVHVAALKTTSTGGVASEIHNNQGKSKLLFDTLF